MLTDHSLQEPPGNSPGGSLADGGTDTPGWHVAPLRRDPHEFLVTFLPSEERNLTRTGVALHCLSYWADALGAFVGKHKKVRVYYDPRDITIVHVRMPGGVLVRAKVTTPNIPAMSLGEWAKRRHFERKVCKNATRAQASAQSAQRSHAIVETAQARRKSDRRRASAAAGDVWRSESAPTSPVAPSETNEPESTTVPTLASTPTLYAIEEMDYEL